MSSADFLDEWFETDVLKATMSASGIIGTFMGPRSPGTAYVLLHHYMGELDGAFRSWGFARGGMGSISRVIAEAARHHGAEIRTQAPVDQVLIKNGRACGVVLASGEEIQSKVVVSGVDPKRTFLKMVDGRHLDAEFTKQVSNFKIRGSSAKVNLSLDALPNFTSMPGDGPHLAGAISISPESRLHRARLRRREIRRFFAPALHGYHLAIDARSVHGAAGQTRHVDLRAVRALSSKKWHLAGETRSARRCRDRDV